MKHKTKKAAAIEVAIKDFENEGNFTAIKPVVAPASSKPEIKHLTNPAKK